MLPVVLHLGGELAGFFLSFMVNRVAVFMDAQNVYRGARDCFAMRQGPPQAGQFSPLRFARLLCDRKNSYQPSSTVRTLTQVRIYTGRPDSSKAPRTYAAHMRQCAAWERAGATVISRALRYPRDWPERRAEEKGIDVQLAIDFVAGAFDDEYDTGIVCSTDTDLLPALEFVATRYPRKHVETAAWQSEGWRSELRLWEPATWCHRLGRADYEAVRDPVDYATA